MIRKKPVVPSRTPSRMRLCRAAIDSSDSTPPRCACISGVFARRDRIGPRSSHGSSQKFVMGPLCSGGTTVFGSEDRLQHVHDPVVLVDDRQVPPLVEGG